MDTLCPCYSVPALHQFLTHFEWLCCSKCKLAMFTRSSYYVDWEIHIYFDSSRAFFKPSALWVLKFS